MYARPARSHGSWKSFVVRGDVHAIRLPRRRGHGEHGRRLAVIVQADDLLALSPILVCPTSMSTPPRAFIPRSSSATSRRA
jgi:mRNA-degrading endonuclease toxin of MazEF toxin-antitoxin module